MKKSIAMHRKSIVLVMALALAAGAAMLPSAAQPAGGVHWPEEWVVFLPVNPDAPVLPEEVLARLPESLEVAGERLEAKRVRPDEDGVVAFAPSLVLALGDPSTGAVNSDEPVRVGEPKAPPVEGLAGIRWEPLDAFPRPPRFPVLPVEPLDMYDFTEGGGRLDPARAPDGPAIVEGSELDIRLDRTAVLAGRRWHKSRIRLKEAEGNLEETRLRVALFPPGGDEAVERLEIDPEEKAGVLLVDLRRHGLDRGRVMVEVHHRGRASAGATYFLRTQPPKQTLPEGRNIPLHLDWPDRGAAEDARPASFGVPFPEGALWDPQTVRLFREPGEEIPARVTVVGRWAPDGAIQWLRFDAAVSPGESYYLAIVDPNRPLIRSETELERIDGEGNNPPQIHVNPGWIYESGALGPLHSADADRFPELEAFAEEVCASLVETGREVRPDLLWNFYARTGRREFRDWAEMQTMPRLREYLADRTPVPAEGAVAPPGFDDLRAWGSMYRMSGNRLAKEALDLGLRALRADRTPEETKTNTSAVERIHRAKTALAAFSFSRDPRIGKIATEALNEIFAVPESGDPGDSIVFVNTPSAAELSILAWEAFGDSDFLEAAMTLARRVWEFDLWAEPPGQGNLPALTRSLQFLYDHTEEAKYGVALDLLIRRERAAGGFVLDGAGAPSERQAALALEAIPLIQHVLEGTGADRGYPASWLAYEGTESSVRIAAGKGDASRLDILLASPGQTLPSVGGETVQLTRLSGSASRTGLISVGEETRGGGPGAVARIRIPVDAGNEADIAIHPSHRQEGEQFVFASHPSPLVLYAPEGWLPLVLSPAPRIYFRISEEDRDARIVFDGEARLFNPDGTVFREGKVVGGEVELGNAVPGLWSFEPVSRGMVKADGFAPFFAMGSPDSYFAPEL